MLEDIGSDAAPQQLHHGAVAVIGVDTGSAEFQDAPGRGFDRRNIVLPGRVELPDPLRAVPLDQPIGADNAFRSITKRVVNHQQMIRYGIVDIPVARRGGGRGIGTGTHLLVKHAIAQRLDSVDLGGIRGQPHPQVTAS